MGKAKNHNMKVTHINTELSWGGGEAQTYYLVKGLENRGIENILIAQPNSALAEKVKEGQIKLIELYMKGGIGHCSRAKTEKNFKKDKTRCSPFAYSSRPYFGAFSQQVGQSQNNSCHKKNGPSDKRIFLTFEVQQGR
ncbi:unnamed protein product [marine sediment metagenome]|uniref:Glycosyltransferase subfamily 4-like N-terminal domain-containing protein n=1 Tax=marine sediment metagenome TaxID=412755 RepID=X1MU36_9ZZZZ